MAEAARAKRGMATNGVYSAATEISIGFLFVLLVIAARVLGDEQFGVFSFALAFVNVMGFIMEGGLAYVYTRTVARSPELARRYMGNVLTLQLLFCAAGIVSVFVVLIFLDQPAETMYVIYLLAAAEALRTVKYLFRFAFRTADYFDLETLTVYIERVLLFVLAVGALLAGYGVVGFAWAFVITRVIDLTLTIIIFARSIFMPKMYFEVTTWPPMVKQCLPFILTAAVMMMLYKIDSVILALLRTDAEVGWYNAAYRLIDGLYLFPKIMSNVLYPRISAAHRDHAQVTRMYGQSIKYVFMIALPTMLIGVAAADEVILLLYGTEYINAIGALQVLLFSVLFLFMYEVSFSLLAAIDRQPVFFAFSAVALVLNVVLNFLLIPSMSYIGAGIATVLSQLAFAVMISIYLHIIGYGVPLLRPAIRPLVAAGAMAAITHLWLDNLLLIVPITVVGYFLLLTLMRFWDSDEIFTAQKGLNRLRRLLPGYTPV